MKGILLYVIGSLEVGGAEQHLVQVACALKERGWGPEFFVLVPHGPLAEKLQAAGIPIHAPSVPRWLERIGSPRFKARLQLVLALAGLSLTMLRRRPAATHFFLPAAYLLGGIAAVLTGTRPRLMSRRSLNLYQSTHPVYARFERLLHPRMDRVCGNSRAVMAQLAAEDIAPERLRLIYNGIDLERFPAGFDRAAKRRELGLSDDALVFVIVANLIPYKGHADLLEALALMKQNLGRPWACLCVGRDDTIGGGLRQRASALGIGDEVRWLGSRTDVPELLGCADIGVLCSHEEGFSNAVLESMAAGLPMVVTDVGGNAEAVTDGVNGRVVPPRQPALLAAALLAVALDPDRVRMGRAGRSRVEQMFSLPACVDAYEKLYREVITEKH
ncbi:glycosyltransferase [Sulfurisoma sediminicola]|uniref:Glycosyltransferase involved in cell wall biosynthesis n=1 Tax=Sulfurisoma sediminicola TaxID=1381557 RepID=A0A497XJA1_9PROT|nr:glycosyltransferase [Sulfurisoma sediminicola]RLJ67991.1 glycosyltransferase involved in cell wall biosynthesis [Sulfurisoma sediminicola]